VKGENVEILLFNTFTKETYPIEESLVLKHNAFSFIIQKPSAYSKIKFDEVFTRVRWPREWNVRNEQDAISMIEDKHVSDESLMLKVDKPDLIIPDEEEMVEFAMSYLTRFKCSIQLSPKYLESTRRWIINGCLLAAISTSSKNVLPIGILSEYSFDSKGPRIGTGPLDYYFFSPKVSFAALAVDAHQIETSEEVDENKNLGLLEAKQFLDGVYLSDALGQMCAQSLDLLQSITIQKNPTKKAKLEEGNRRVLRSVKSIISTGHHYFFFTFTEYDEDVVPNIEYCGKYSIDVLPKDTDRNSGLSVGEQLKTPQIKKLLRAYFVLLHQ
jgi:hypothetical protein